MAHSYIETAKMYQATPDVHLIANERGLTEKTVRCHLSKARAAGGLAPMKRKSFERGIPMGNFSGAVYGMPKHVKAWVQDNIPEGASVADFFAAVVTDACNDALEAEDRFQ